MPLSSTPESRARAEAMRRARLAGWLNDYGPALRNFFARKVGPDDAQDLVQDVFLSLHRSERDDHILNVERYLFKVAHNILADHYRRRAIQGDDRTLDIEDVAEPADEISPERILVGQWEYERMVAAIRRLPPRTQTAFLLHRYQRLTYPVIAQRMGISRSAVKQLVLRAMTRIVEEMEHGP